MKFLKEMAEKSVKIRASNEKPILNDGFNKKSRTWVSSNCSCQESIIAVVIYPYYVFLIRVELISNH